MQMSVQHRKDGTHVLAAWEDSTQGKWQLFHPLLEATQLSLSPYVSDISQITAPLLEPRVSACSECVHRLCQRTSGCPAAFHPTLVVRIPTVFHNQMLWELLFLEQVLWAGGPTVGLGSLAPWGNPS